MTLGRNAVGYLTESVHGAGSPQAQRVQIARGMQLDYRKRLARLLAGIDDVADSDAPADELTGYFAEVFRTHDIVATTTSSTAGGDRL
jgi:4-hydroxybutyryl-CoA dehydratase/vinylacetyl-CoA-Delta-isomerase